MGKILRELEHHAPFTVFGAFTGIVIMMFFQRVPSDIAYKIFYALHPTHVVLSAFVTSSMFSLHKSGRLKGRIHLFTLLLIGYIGSIGIATLSDSLIPYLGEALLRMPHREMHIGFIEEWRIVNLSALIGIAVAYFKPTTKIPHAMHIFVSTWASLFHVIMAIGGVLSFGLYIGIFFFLFIAVWVPCCFSDIVFPLLFVAENK